MKISTAAATLGTVALMVFTLGFACGDSKSATSDATGPASNAAADNPPKPVETDIAGDYTANGTNPDGKGEYKADLSIKKQGEVFQFSWTSAGREYDGVGVVNGKHAAVSYTDGKDGKGCGVVLYQIKPDGTLQGKSGYWGVNEAEVESATRASGDGLEGSYTVKGTNPAGKDYGGKLSVSKSGEGYTFKWNTGTSFEGFGIRGGEMIAVGFGGKQCAFVGYDIESDGTLNGRWGSRHVKDLRDRGR